ncbi:MAG: hypothetical protein LBS40_08580 [Burkholderiales bacterium]|jgi:hypothetical protein|nr:hypothetical protein [Burkholderiales bacterium]
MTTKSIRVFAADAKDAESLTRSDRARIASYSLKWNEHPVRRQAVTE